MFQQLFAVMNDLLDDIMLRYPHCSSEERKEMLEQLAQLRGISDQFIEEWLRLEEKMADFREEFPAAAASAGITAGTSFPLPEIAGAGGAQSAAATATGASDSRIAGTGIVTAAMKEALCGPAIANGMDMASKPQQGSFAMDVSGDNVERIAKGQGYFKLFMFPQAARHFQEAVECSPECDLARMYLAMTLMHLQQWSDAELHFKLLVSLTDHPRWQAIGFNALGCIQAVRLNMDHAERLFRQAHKIDPAFEDPITNLKSCRQTPGPLSLYFGSAELTCL